MILVAFSGHIWSQVQMFVEIAVLLPHNGLQSTVVSFCVTNALPFIDN